ncbi:MAG: PKD domain-containing protein, partial [Deltaproteobacteria bacterium]
MGTWPAQAALPPGFQRSTVVSGLSEPTVLEFAPDGRLFVGERGGRILTVENGSLLPLPLVQLAADTLNGERGLVGLALDPNFATNGYLYAYYTTNEPRNRVGRLTVVGNTADPSSEVVIWQNPDLAADFHHGGTIHFGPDGALYIATGDQMVSANAQDLSNQHGKILRVARDGTIPPDNPFVRVPGAQAPIWAYGLRNPFRFVFDPATGALWIGDVGGNVAESWEEVNRGVPGANYGWPNQEGRVCYVSDCSAYTFPVYAYQHNNPAYSTDQVQASITLGPVYRASAFPAAYQGALFFGDYANRWIRSLVFDAGGVVSADPLFDSPPDAGTIVDLRVGPDGALYTVTIGVAFSGEADVGAVHRLAFPGGGGNQPPVAVESADPRQGPAPLTVPFTSAGSTDPDSGPGALTFSWTFGDGGTSTEPNPVHTYAARGLYLARLTVSDGAAATTTDAIPITVGSPPVAIITQPPPGTLYRAGDVIPFAGTATDLEDGALGAGAFVWQVVLRHADHTHPFFGPTAGATQGSFTIPATGHGPENTFYEIELTAIDSDGLQGKASRAILPVVSPLALDTVPSGIPIFLDGQPQLTPRVYQSLSGFIHTVEAQPSFVLGAAPYLFDRWSDGGARVHTLVAPEGGGGATAFYTPTASVLSTASVRFRGTGGGTTIDRIKVPVDPPTPADVGAGDFTVEFWMRGTLADNVTPSGPYRASGDTEESNVDWIYGNIIV